LCPELKKYLFPPEQQNPYIKTPLLLTGQAKILLSRQDPALFSSNPPVPLDLAPWKFNPAIFFILFCFILYSWGNLKTLR
jgi:hypothetical protein